MVKLKTWFKKHIKREAFSFMGFILSMMLFFFNLATSRIIPMQISLLDRETISFADPLVFYIPFTIFSIVLLSIAFICLYLFVSIRRKK